MRHVRESFTSYMLCVCHHILLIDGIDYIICDSYMVADTSYMRHTCVICVVCVCHIRLIYGKITSCVIVSYIVAWISYMRHI